MITVLEFYSGIGGLHYALEKSSIEARVLAAFDWDQLACRVHSHNFPNTPVKQIDICTLTVENLAAYAADLWLLSPSCQPYTILNQIPRDSGDPRAKPFLRLINDVLPSLAMSNALPGRLLIENVAGFETSLTRQTLLTALSRLGYSVIELLLTPLAFGIPNSRLRYYLLARFEPFSFSGGAPAAGISRHIPGHGMDWLDDRNQLEVSLTVLYPLGSSRSGEDYSTSFYQPHTERAVLLEARYTKMVERTGSILQENELLDTKETFDRFLQARAEGDPNSTAILAPLCLRYFSPEELSRLFGLGTGSRPFTWPAAVTAKSRYRLIGNSVNVHVVAELVNYLFK